ncbi:MAG: D-alanyl-D-alanine carboxypeptidase [Oscillospiraceae bacterium]|nr:D-alanyl-D-alanine carboxypeptidase [Oscillospiraceae bacterium]
MKRTVFLLVLSLCLALCAPLAAFADEGYPPNFEVSAKGVYMYNLDTESVIYQKNADTPLYPASVTKIMTCILALENTDNLDMEDITYPNYVQDYLYDYQYIQKNGEVSKGGLLAGEVLSMRDALYALMLPSANEVAMIIADHIGGSQEGFVEMMNAKARELGATNTNFVNANGLFDSAHVTTAHDIYLMARHAMELPGFMDIVTTVSYQCPPTNKHPEGLNWSTTNLMMVPNNLYYYPPLKGIKTGTLPDSGRCFVSTATRDGFTYLLVVLGSTYLDETGAAMAENMAFVETRQLYEWVFDTFRVKNLVDKGKYVAEIPLRLNLDQDHVKLMTAERFTALLPNDIDSNSVTLIPEIPDAIDAPVTKGQYVGEVALILSGEEIGRVDLLSVESVEASQVLVLLEKAKEITRSFWFKFAIVLFVFLFVFYIVLMILRNRRRRRSGFKPKRRL